MSTYHIGAMVERCSIDVLGPFKPFPWLPVPLDRVTNQFTRWAEAFAMRVATALRIARNVVNFLCHMGWAKELSSKV
jgi:hypothetical protein